MIRIFLETGENQAKSKNKKTTNEQDFIVKFIEHHFPTKKYGVDFEVSGLGGKDTLDISAPMFYLKNEEDKNVVIFDADTDKNGGGFTKRRDAILKQKTALNLDFDLFLWPNNKDDGDFENLLLGMINPRHQGVLDCYEGFEKCVSGRDPNGEEYELPGRKGEVYTYIEIMKLTEAARKELHKGFYQFDNSDYWDLDAQAGNVLKSFFSQFFREGE